MQSPQMTGTTIFAHFNVASVPHQSINSHHHKLQRGGVTITIYKGARLAFGDHDPTLPKAGISFFFSLGNVTR